MFCIFSTFLSLYIGQFFENFEVGFSLTYLDRKFHTRVNVFVPGNEAALFKFVRWLCIFIPRYKITYPGTKLNIWSQNLVQNYIPRHTITYQGIM
jgi:hypothetical protein